MLQPEDLFTYIISHTQKSWTTQGVGQQQVKQYSADPPDRRTELMITDSYLDILGMKIGQQFCTIAKKCVSTEKASVYQLYLVFWLPTYKSLTFIIIFIGNF